MPFIAQGKTNLKYILIIVVLAVIVGGGILAWQYWWAPSPPSPVKPPVTPSEVSPTDETAKQQRSADYIYIVQSGKVAEKEGDYTLIKMLPDGTGQEELLNTNTADGCNNATRVSPDRNKIYVPGVGIYDLKTKNLIPYKVDQPAGQDCAWFDDSQRLACIYFSDHGSLKQTFKISIIDLDGKEEVVKEEFVDISEEVWELPPKFVSYFHNDLNLLGVRNGSEMIFRTGRYSIFIKFDLSSKKFSVIYRLNIKGEQSNLRDMAVYSNTLDKIAFINEIKVDRDLKDPNSSNQYSVNLFALSLKTNKTEEVYSTGIGPDFWSPSRLAISDDKTKVAFQFIIGDLHPVTNYKVVVADLTNNQVEIFDFPLFDEEKFLESPQFRGFSSDPNDLIFYVRYADIIDDTLEIEDSLFSFNTQTKELRKIISHKSKFDFGDKEGSGEPCCRYSLPNSSEY